MQDVKRKLQRHDCRDPHYSCSVSARQEKKAEFDFDRCLNLRRVSPDKAKFKPCVKIKYK